MTCTAAHVWRVISGGCEVWRSESRMDLAQGGVSMFGECMWPGTSDAERQSQEGD